MYSKSGNIDGLDYSLHSQNSRIIGSNNIVVCEDCKKTCLSNLKTQLFMIVTTLDVIVEKDMDFFWQLAHFELLFMERYVFRQ